MAPILITPGTLSGFPPASKPANEAAASLTVTLSSFKSSRVRTPWTRFASAPTQAQGAECRFFLASSFDCLTLVMFRQS